MHNVIQNIQQYGALRLLSEKSDDISAPILDSEMNNTSRTH